MKSNNELVDIITILDDYDCVVKSINTGYRYVEYFSKEGKFLGAEFEDILENNFPR